MTSHHRNRLILVVALCAASSTTTALRAAVIQVDNLANATAGASATLNFTTSQRAAAFTTDVSAPSWRLGSITAQLQASAGADSVAQMQLFSDNSGVPGTLIETLGGNPTPTSLAEVTFTSAGTTLSPNTTYWAVLSKISGTTLLEWGLTSDFSESSPDAWMIADKFTFSENSGASWGSNSNFAPKLSVTVIPEPVTFTSLMVLATLGAAARARRRR